MDTRPRSVAQELAVFMLAYGAASLVHFAHNAEFLAEYPNMPSWLSRADVYVAWLGLTSVGVLGYVLVGFGYRLLGLSVVIAYAALGLDSLGHYVIAPMSAHTAAMNSTIMLEVTTAAVLLIKSLRLIARCIAAREIRRATASQAGALSSLAMEAKAHWGYSRETLESWKDQLHVSPSDVASKPTYVRAIGGEVVGFYSLAPSERTWELDNLWVAPRFMHRGVGRALLAHALEVAFRGGAAKVTVDADPNAESFYLSCGAVRRGEVAAPIAGQPDRVRPQLAFDKR